MNLRFLWLAMSIIIPIFSVQYISQEEDELVLSTYIFVAVFSEIVVISLAVSEFVKAGKVVEYLKEQQIKEDRDADISKWRKEFLNDSLDLYDMQKESLKRAKDLNEKEFFGNKFSEEPNQEKEQTQQSTPADG